mgnify:FL=1
MFTGIVAETGKVSRVERSGQGIHLKIHARRTADRIQLGDSLAVNGCCLTVVEVQGLEGEEGSLLGFDLLQETWERTNLQSIECQSEVNLERPLAFQSGLDGHFVSGHVDGVATIRRWEEQGADWLLEVEPPLEMMPLLVTKGSVALDGISLTVAEVLEQSFRVWVIPHTRKVTNLKNRKTGDGVNIETDLLGKYVDRLLKARGL